MQREDREDIAPHRWLSNPLDWSHIDRMILLAGMTLLTPLAFGGALLAAILLVPQWLDRGIAAGLLALYALYGILLAGFLAAAFRRRRAHANWPLLENFIIVSYLAVTFIESWLSGTHFTCGMLLLLLGVYLTSALADIRKVRLAFHAAALVLVAMAVAQYSGRLAYAPLFAVPPLHADGSPLAGWFLVQFTLVMVLMGLARISLLAIERWIERENLYREMSTIDGLTRLTNRRSFIERSESEFARARRMPVGGISCVMIDIDHFKRINDTRGHHAGDAVLVQTSALLLESARQYDEVGRYGGEEFAILLPSTTPETATMVAERLRERIAAQHIVVDGEPIRLTASFGVASYPAPGIENINDLLKAADGALYEAKHSGRNRVVAARPAPPSA